MQIFIEFVLLQRNWGILTAKEAGEAGCRWTGDSTAVLRKIICWHWTPNSFISSMFGCIIYDISFSFRFRVFKFSHHARPTIWKPATNLRYCKAQLIGNIHFDLCAWIVSIFIDNLLFIKCQVIAKSEKVKCTGKNAIREF